MSASQAGEAGSEDGEGSGRPLRAEFRSAGKPILMGMYRPPLRDIKFVLEHVADLPSLVQLPDFGHVDLDTVDGLLDEAGRFMAEVVAPTNRVGDTQGSVRNDDGSVSVPDEFAKAYQQYVAAGWNGIKGDPEFGGHGFPGVVGLAVQEMLTTANMAFSLCPMLTMSTILALTAHGTDEQKAGFLSRLISGEWTGTMVLTEPEAGSDVGALRTRAVPAEDGNWRITGTKIFITWGEHDMAENIVHLVLARAPGAPPGTKGISLFIVPKFLLDAEGEAGERNSVSCVSIEHKLGIHGSPTCVMSFDEAVGFLVGEVHQGMRGMFTMMNDARVHVGLEGLGVTERAYQQAVQFAATRHQGRAGGDADGSSPIIDHPDVRRMLMTMRANAEAMRGLLYDTARSLDLAAHHPDAGTRAHWRDRAGLLTPVAKAWCTDLGVEMTSLALQVHGGMGYVEETGAAQHYRDARIAPIYEGTNGIQAIDLVLRKLPVAGGEVVRSYLSELAAMRDRVEASGPPLEAAARELGEGIELLRNTTEWLLARDNPNDRLAAATPYLRLFGIVAGGAYLALGAAVAVEAGADEDPFLTAKIATARFYAEQLLPQAFGLVPAATAHADALFAASPEMLGA